MDMFRNGPAPAPIAMKDTEAPLGRDAGRDSAHNRAAVVIFGISGALFGDITFKDGRVEQTNFHDYRVLRMYETPRIETHIVASSETPGGMGEPGTSALAPALANAVFAATGKRIRKLPITPASLQSTAGATA